MKEFERRQIKKSFTLPLLHLTSSVFSFSSVCHSFALCLVLCCAGTVLWVALTMTSTCKRQDIARKYPKKPKTKNLWNTECRCTKKTAFQKKATTNGKRNTFFGQLKRLHTNPNPNPNSFPLFTNEL